MKPPHTGQRILVGFALTGGVAFTLGYRPGHSLTWWLVGYPVAFWALFLVLALRLRFLNWRDRRRLRRAWREMNARSLSTLTRRAVPVEKTGISVRVWIGREPDQRD